MHWVKMLAVQAWGPELISQHSIKPYATAWTSVILAFLRGGAETQDSPSKLAWQLACHSQKDKQKTLSQINKRARNSIWVCPLISACVLCVLHLLTKVCIHTCTGVHMTHTCTHTKACARACPRLKGYRAGSGKLLWRCEFNQVVREEEPEGRESLGENYTCRSFRVRTDLIDPKWMIFSMVSVES